MTGAAPDVSVLVVSWRTRELTLACLRSVERAAAGSGLAAETVVVDNASGDGTPEAVAAEHPGAALIASDRNLGFAAACNLAAARATARHLLLLNPDAEVGAEALAALVRFLDETPGAGAAGCRLVSPAGETQFSCGRFLTPLNQFAETLGATRALGLARLGRSYGARDLSAPAAEVDWVVGACLAVRREAFEAVGGLDERFFMYSEDEDLCYRLRAEGWTVHHLSGVSVRHVGGGSAAQALGPMREAARASQAAFLRKHRGRASELLFRALSRLAALKPRRHPDRVGWGG